jgi:2',3'-cyclic-nucleotide 2'-phosphodiesterase (5'-nucleotidase family)
MKTFANITVFALALGVFAQQAAAQGASVTSNGASSESGAQAAADVIRGVAGTDFAFLASGLLRSTYNKDDLSSILEFPTDEIVIVSLTGAEIRNALERSIQLYPQSNTSFLQVSGVDISFKKNALPNERIVSVTTPSGPLSDTKTYTVAMPGNLGRGGLGYFKIWHKGKISKSLGTTLEQALKGKKFVDSSPRWSAAG